MSIPIPTIKRIDNLPPTPKVSEPTIGNRPVPKRTGPEWNNQKVVRSDSANEGYRYVPIDAFGNG